MQILCLQNAGNFKFPIYSKNRSYPNFFIKSAKKI